MPVDDLARGDVVTATPDTAVSDLAATMRDEDVGSVVVTDGDEPVGVVTDRDLATRVLPDAADASDLTAGHVMTADVVTVDASDGFYEVSSKMSDHGVRRIPVVDDGSLVGIITVDDLVELLSDEQEHVAGVIRAQRPPY